MPSIESVVVRVVANVSGELAPRLESKSGRKPAAFPTLQALELMQDLGVEARTLLEYLESPDFAVVAAQLRIRERLGQPARDQIHEGLRLAGVSEQFLVTSSDVIYRALVAACDEVGVCCTSR